MEIICDQCGAVLPQPEWKTIRDGEFEHTYFVCDSCGAAYPFSVTDKRLKEDNVKRSRELKEQHPLPPLILSE